MISTSRVHITLQITFLNDINRSSLHITQQVTFNTLDPHSIVSNIAGHIEPYVWGFRLLRECIYNKTFNTLDTHSIIPNMAI